ncbi:alpha/beta hydrolase [Tychonema sp. LEGE 07203]|uniref:alpha/beta hydrolase n=1 Tax=Tychonema sp. LEGE 07203 TaxID=1828671 RepID=UPI0018818140|nr:alpha/beta hydrolase [Tychonema sp. LEGE 07203]MBE9095411.1 alpha/beta hydrolase [Tychonema sp. LEGE 07203]
MLPKNNGKKLLLLAAFSVSRFIPRLLSAIGLFFSLWVILPAPTLFLYPLAVGSPEISPWLVGINTIALLLNLLGRPNGKAYIILLICNLCALILSLLPLMQFPAASAAIATQMQAVLGRNYLATVPDADRAQMRSQPFILADSFRGIAMRDVRSDRAIVFANPDGVSLKLNLYRPMQIGKYPAIITIYGGAWQKGNPDYNEEFSRYMAARGYCVVAIDYRHAPKYQFPAQLEDVQAALSYIKNHAADWSIDLDRIALMGRSAGAHLAMLTAYGSSVLPVRAVVNYYGPNDLIRGYNDPPFPDAINVRAVLRAFLGGTPEQLKELYRRASPINYIKPNLPPSLLVYAGRDHIVQAKFGRSLYERLRATGDRAILLEIPWAEHAFDTIFNGPSNQLALYCTERFLAWALKSSDYEFIPLPKTNAAR